MAEEIANILREDGIELLLESHPLRGEETSDGHIRLTVRSASGDASYSGSHLLAAKRSPPRAQH